MLANLAAGAIWSGIFVGPRVLPQYDALTFSLARYLCFGVLSCHRAAAYPAFRQGR